MQRLFLLLLLPLIAFGQESALRLVRETEALTPEQEQAKLHAPAGFAVQLFASEPMINKPINMTFDARGRLWVSSTVEYPYSAAKDRWSDAQGSRVNGSRDAIKILEDTDGDGRADKVTDFADGLNIPTGVLPWHKPEHKDGCIAWSIPNIWYFADTDGDGKCDLREVLFGPLGYEKDTHGMCSSFRLGLDGWVYATHGFNNTSHFKTAPKMGDGSDASQQAPISHLPSAISGAELTLHSGNVFRFRPDGSRVELYSAGQVNPFGLCWDRYGNLYSADCHSNPITQLIRGACYPSFGKPHDGLGFGPVMCAHSHGSTGLCGIIYIDGGVWGPEWDNHMFLGNCVTSKVNHDFISFTGSTPKANEQPDFITSDDPWFRPVDLQLGPDNALYIADFYNKIIGHYEVPLDHPGRDRERGRIWRVVKQEAKPQPMDFTAMAPKQIAEELGNANLTRHHLALREVKRRGTKAWLPQFFDIFSPTHAITPRGDSRPEKIAPQDESYSDFIDNISLKTADTRSAYSLWALSYLGERLLISEVLRELHMGGAWIEDKNGEQEGLIMSQAEQIIGSYDKLHGWEKWGLGVTFDSRGCDAGRAACQVLLNRPDALDGDPTWPGWVADFLVRQLNGMLDPSNNDKQYSWNNPNDTQYIHAMRILLRDMLSKPGALKALQNGTGAIIDKAWFIDVLKAVPNAEASAFLLSRLNHGVSGDASLWVHLARYADEPTLSAAIDQARALNQKDIEAQVSALDAFHNGLLERGSKPPFSLLAWATELAQASLAKEGQTEAAWQSLPHPDFPQSKSPWCVQERKCVDGKVSIVLSSLNQKLKGPEKLTGILRSKPFPAPAKLSFWLCGHQGFPKAAANQKNLVRLIDEHAAVLQQAFPPRNDVCQRIEWDLSTALGKRVCLEIVDGDNGAAYAWLGVGRFEQAELSTDGFNDADARQKQLRSLATILRTTAPVGLRDKLAKYLPAPAVAPAPAQSQPELDTLIAARRAAFAQAKPDASKGEQIFTANCAVCHTLGGKGGLIGPQLDGIGNRGADRLIEDILDPNRNVDAHFHLHQLKLRDDSIATGFVRGEVGQLTILVDAAGNEQRISKGDIAEDKDLPQSLMPPNFGQMIPVATFNDLIAWLLKK